VLVLAAGSLEASLSPSLGRSASAVPVRQVTLGLEPFERILRGHSHNDFEQLRPLEYALALGFHSVEADVWWHDGDVLVSHMGLRWYGSLEQLYLEPLEERIRRSGSVLGDGLPFQLWIDLKSSDPSLGLALHALLTRHRRLFARHGTFPPISVILTGDDVAKRAVVRDFPDPGICRDEERFDALIPSTESAPCWYSLPWGETFAWTGTGPMPVTQRQRLQTLVDQAHLLGRRVRFWATPESERLWQELLDAGVDLISTDELGRLRHFLAGYSASQLAQRRHP
jgi:hypothetical protein